MVGFQQTDFRIYQNPLARLYSTIVMTSRSMLATDLIMQRLQRSSKTYTDAPKVDHENFGYGGELFPERDLEIRGNGVVPRRSRPLDFLEEERELSAEIFGDDSPA